MAEDSSQDGKTYVRLVRLAQSLEGGTEALAARLGALPGEIVAWANAAEVPPLPLFERLLEVVLEAHERRFPDPPPAPAKPPARRSRRTRILIADDHPDSAEALGALLELHGHEVRKATSGRRALELHEAFRPEVAVIDLNMPRMSGYAVAREIRARERRGEATLVALTGYGGRADMTMALRSGFDYYFRKPLTLEYLLQVFPD